MIQNEDKRSWNKKTPIFFCLNTLNKIKKGIQKMDKKRDKKVG